MKVVYRTPNGKLFEFNYNGTIEDIKNMPQFIINKKIYNNLNNIQYNPEDNILYVLIEERQLGVLFE